MRLVAESQLCRGVVHPRGDQHRSPPAYGTRQIKLTGRWKMRPVAKISGAPLAGKPAGSQCGVSVKYTPGGSTRLPLPPAEAPLPGHRPPRAPRSSPGGPGAILPARAQAAPSQQLCNLSWLQFSTACGPTKCSDSGAGHRQEGTIKRLVQAQPKGASLPLSSIERVSRKRHKRRRPIYILIGFTKGSERRRVAPSSHHL